MATSGVSPSGQTWYLVERFTEADFEAASAALDKALLRQIGLPEDVDIRAFENAIADMAEKIKFLASDFSLSRLIAILPVLVMDGAALWEQLKPNLEGKIERRDFITRVIRYIYRKNDPDLPFLVEPFETLVEEMIINAIPELLDNLETKINELLERLGRTLFK